MAVIAVAVMAAVAAALVLMAVLARPAAAHVALLFTSPAADGAVPLSPTALALTFDSPVALPARPVTVKGPAGAPVTLGRPVLRTSELTVPVAQMLRPGTYTVTWQVTADDGDAVTGRYRFAVGPQASGSGPATGGYTSPPAAAGLWPTVVLRWLLLAALAVALGGLAGARLARRRSLRTPREVPRPWVRSAAVVGAASAAGLALVVAGGGGLLSGAAHPLRALDSRPGMVAVVEAAAFTLVATAACLAKPRRRPRWAAAGLLAVVAAEAVRGHPQEASPGWGALVISVHLVAAAVWIGALAQVIRTALAWRDTPRLAWRLIGDYARLAIWLFAAVVVSGTIAGLLILPLDAVPATGYGRTLLVKLAVVAAAAGLALRARLRLRRGPGNRSERSARAESGALAAVLAVTALLVSVPPPLDADRPLPFAPPPSGPVLPLGALAGQVSISGTVSAGQLVLRLFVPGSEEQDGAPAGAAVQVAGPQGPARPGPRYELAAALADPAGRSHRLPTRRCGAGCFVAPARWSNGTSQLSVRATVSGTVLGSLGGAVAFPVAWPPRSDAAALRRTLQTMRKVGRFTLYERVTSDTGRGPGTLKKITLTGKRFTGSEPYRANAPIALRDGPASLVVALPAERVHTRLTLDGQGRITAQTLTAPRYLITRTFAYPHQDTP